MTKIERISEAYFKTKQLLDKSETLKVLKDMREKDTIRVAIMEGSRNVNVFEYRTTKHILDLVIGMYSAEIEHLSDEINQIEIK